MMLQQTPVARVLPVHEAWLERWPTPADLAAEPAGEAVRAWGRLGYPRRALRLHAAATAIVERYDGEVPDTYDELLTLPGVGDYTAAAVASFAFGRRHVVLDTNVRRVLARVLARVEFPGAVGDQGRARPGRRRCSPTTTNRRHLGGRRHGARRPGLHRGAARAARTARSPTSAPGAPPAHPAYAGPPRRGQAWAGTDRQCRGRIMAVLRDADGPVPAAGWRPSGPTRAARALPQTLIDDGLVAQAAADSFIL